MNIDIFGSAADIRSSISSPLLAEALDYWEALPRTGKFPPRSSVDPMSITRLLPTIFLADAEEDGGFRYRLAGRMQNCQYGIYPVSPNLPLSPKCKILLNIGSSTR